MFKLESGKTVNSKKQIYFLLFFFNCVAFISKDKFLENLTLNFQNLKLQRNSSLIVTEGTDTETGILAGGPTSAMCVQESEDSRNSAIRSAYRILLRSSSNSGTYASTAENCFEV